MRKIEALGQDDAGVGRWERENLQRSSLEIERLELLHAAGMCFKKSNLPIWVHSKDDRRYMFFAFYNSGLNRNTKVITTLKSRNHV